MVKNGSKTEQVVERNNVDQKNQDESWLSIASFVLSLLGMNILALIFWIICLKQKNSKWAALSGVIIAWSRLVFRVIFLVMMGASFYALINYVWNIDNSLDATDVNSDIDYVDENVYQYEMGINNISVSENDNELYIMHGAHTFADSGVID